MPPAASQQYLIETLDQRVDAHAMHFASRAQGAAAARPAGWEEKLLPVNSAGWSRVRFMEIHQIQGGNVNFVTDSLSTIVRLSGAVLQSL